jgi:rfaE bifunctional protein kinase chain/domain
MNASSSSRAVLDELKARAKGARNVVFVSGNFNVVHPGHLRLLRFAAECGDFLVVGVHDDSRPGVSVPAAMRLENVRAISLVNFAFTLHEPPEAFIARLKPAVVVKGKEHENRDNPEAAATSAYGGKLLFSSGESSFSSLDLLHKEYFEANFSTIKKPVDFPARHAFEVAALKQGLARMKGLRVVVIGDLIVDEYITCDPLGMSQEDPTIVVTPIEHKQFIGGAGIVAAHAKGLGAEVRYFTVTGQDDTARFANDRLQEYGVRVDAFTDESRPTTLKQRYRAAGKTLLRVSHLRQHDVPAEILARMLKAIKRGMDSCDLVVFADFNYGCLPQQLVDEVVTLGRKRGVTMVADSQASSQMSDVSRFTGMSLITPTEREARLAMRDPHSGLVVLAEALGEKAQAGNVVVTLGAEGVLINARSDDGWLTDRLPAFNTVVKDPAGAGDSLLTCSAMALCAGIDIWRSVYLGSLAAACQVARVGNIPLMQADITAEIEAP